MKTLTYKILATALLSGFALGASAQGMAKPEYKAQEEKIESNGKMSKDACDQLAGHLKSVCVVEAKGAEKVAKADLEASYKPGVSNRYKAHVVKADAA